MSSVSKRERVFQAIITVLEGGPNGLRVHRNPARPIEQDALPALVVSMPPGRPDAETVERMDHSDGVERILRVRVEIRAGETSITSLNAGVDEAYIWTVQQLRSDPTLGGICEDIIERTGTFETGELEKTFQALGAEFDVIYWTSEDDPTAEAA